MGDVTGLIGPLLAMTQYSEFKLIVRSELEVCLGVTSGVVKSGQTELMIIIEITCHFF